MKFENTEVWGFEHALRGMRNPLESWNKSDSGRCSEIDCNKCSQDKLGGTECSKIGRWDFAIGKNDMELAQKLIRAGSVHRKFMRQIFVSVDITAPLYWWKEFDTYKVGTVANSTSTMHKLASTPITMDCFEMDDFENVEVEEQPIEKWYVKDYWKNILFCCENLRQLYNKNMELSKTPNITDQERKRLIVIAKKCWKELIRILPESWLQTRTVTMNYENLIGICSTGQRRNHKLTEWSKSFIDWAKSLPYAGEMLFVDKKPEIDFKMTYEAGIFKCHYNSGEEFESSDGKTWVQIL